MIKQYLQNNLTDGDTCSSLKFTSQKSELIGSCAENKAEHIPDIGHFVKCISNGIYTLKQKNKIYVGVGLLNLS